MEIDKLFRSEKVRTRLATGRFNGDALETLTP